MPAPFSKKHMEFPSRGCLSCLPKSVLKISLARCANCRLAGMAAAWCCGSYGKPYSWGCPGVLESLPARQSAGPRAGSRQMAKSRAYPSPCCSTLFPRGAGVALRFNRSRACPCGTLPKTILKTRFIKFDLLRNRMPY